MHADTRARARACRQSCGGRQAREKSGGARHALDNLGVRWVAIEAGGSREGGERHLSNTQHIKSKITSSSGRCCQHRLPRAHAPATRELCIKRTWLQPSHPSKLPLCIPVPLPLAQLPPPTKPPPGHEAGKTTAHLFILQIRSEVVHGLEPHVACSWMALSQLRSHDARHVLRVSRGSGAARGRQPECCASRSLLKRLRTLRNTRCHIYWNVSASARAHTSTHPPAPPHRTILPGAEPGTEHITGCCLFPPPSRKPYEQ